MPPTAVIVRSTTMVETDCYSCHCVFMVPDWLNQQAREKKREWWCPACGGKSWYSESEVDKLKQQIASKEEWAAYWMKQYEDERDRHERTEARRRAVKGHLTKVKKRVGSGVCPACHRTFKQLAAHMQHKHPDFAADDAAA